ncbi:MAG: hypothetical protein LW688_10970 [Cryomorphaceae bacterium]|nr:hypothetical protein [Cryomorphaceae bacterium]
MSFFDDKPDPLDVTIKKGDKGPSVLKIKNAINAIAKHRGTKEMEIKGEMISFPIEINDVFDQVTNDISIELFPTFKSTGKMNVRISRRRWAYIAGYYEAPFPSLLTEASNYNELINAFINGVIARAKQNREQIAEDLLRAYELLGAKMIRIVDESGMLAEVELTVPAEVPVTSGGNAHNNKETLREKKFGPNPINLEKASEYLIKLKPMSKVLNVMRSRMDGNLLSETFVENVSIGGGASLSIPGAGAKANFSLTRKWEIFVEFYDKTEL